MIGYDIMHVAPPQIAPEFIRNSPLPAQNEPGLGWVEVDQYTLQHKRYPNVFALGDVASSPNAKTGAAALKQASVVVSNLRAVMRGALPTATYNGYVACPITTAYGKLLLCEFDYTGKPTPTIPFIDTVAERYDTWLLKRYGLPWLYWNLMTARPRRAIPGRARHPQAGCVEARGAIRGERGQIAFWRVERILRAGQKACGEDLT